METLHTLAGSTGPMLHHLDACRGRYAEASRWEAGAPLPEWASALLAEMVPLLGAAVASLHLPNPAQPKRLEWVAGFGMLGSVDASRNGQGLVRQVAASGKAFRRSLPPEGLYRLETAICVIEVGHYALLPLLYEEQPQGVLELGFLTTPTPVQEETLACVTGLMGASLHAIFSQLSIQRLYLEAREQSEMLAAQEEEIRQNMEELEATQEEMKRSEQTLLARRSLLEACLDQAAEPILLFDAAERVLFANASFRTRFPSLKLGTHAGQLPGLRTETPATRLLDEVVAFSPPGQNLVLRGRRAKLQLDGRTEGYACVFEAPAHLV